MIIFTFVFTFKTTSGHDLQCTVILFLFWVLLSTKRFSCIFRVFTNIIFFESSVGESPGLGEITFRMLHAQKTAVFICMVQGTLLLLSGSGPKYSSPALPSDVRDTSIVPCRNVLGSSCLPQFAPHGPRSAGLLRQCNRFVHNVAIRWIFLS